MFLNITLNVNTLCMYLGSKSLKRIWPIWYYNGKTVDIMRPIGFQGLEKYSSDNCQASVSIIRLIASALSFSDLGIHWMSNFIFFDMKVWKISIAKRCKSNFMLPISTIFAAALLSVNHLTCHPDSNGLNDSRANAIASNSRQVELFCASDESHNL